MNSSNECEEKHWGEEYADVYLLDEKSVDLVIEQIYQLLAVCQQVFNDKRLEAPSGECL